MSETTTTSNALAMLRRHEWAGTAHGHGGCLECGGIEPATYDALSRYFGGIRPAPSRRRPHRGHRAGCRWRQTLIALEAHRGFVEDYLSAVEGRKEGEGDAG